MRFRISTPVPQQGILTSRLSRLPGRGNKALYVALHDSARASRSFGFKEATMVSRRPYWRSTCINGHALAAAIFVGLTRKALIESGASGIPAMTAFFDIVDVGCRAFFRGLRTAGSSSEHLRFIALVSVLMLCHYEVAGTPSKMTRSLMGGAPFSSRSHRSGLGLVDAR
jgi:hypothetical protein